MRIAASLGGLAMAALAITALAGCKKPQQAAAISAAPAAPTPAPAPVASAAPPPASAAPASLNDISVSLDPSPTHPGDVAGSHELAFMKRFDGSKVVYYESFPYEQIQIGAPDTAHPGQWIFSPSEGQITRLVYQLPTGHGMLEALRNYEQALTAQGFTQLADLTGTTDQFRDFGGNVYKQNWETNADFNWSNLGRAAVPQFGYATFAARSNGKPVTITVLVGSYGHPLDITYGSNKTHWDVSQPFVVEDVVVGKPLGNQMVTVKAADMADALANKGFIDLYGVYFDTDKTDVKPESDATLSEVASLLKIDRSLKLEVSGHTDNTGASAHNMTLSQGRADAVVAALVGKYGIDKSRLVSKG